MNNEEQKIEIPECPVCHHKAFLKKNKYIGWSIGCSKYKFCDGVHVIPMFFKHNLTRKGALKKWSIHLEIYKQLIKERMGR